MRIPDSLAPLVDYGIVQEVVRPLMSGKEAQIYVVVAGGKYAVAKVYKEAQNRTFKHRAEYTEGRKVRNSRDQRAIDKRSKHGRAQDEASWRSTEVDVIRKLHAAGVRVPEPQNFIDGVLIMELITDAEGNPAPRLADLAWGAEEARAMYERLLREVQRMLCVGVVHGDLSDFNILVGAHGPVIIDFPQAVDTAHNANARKLLLRDVDNLHRFLSQFVPHARRLPYAEEMWDLFQQNVLTPETRLTGRYRPAERRANTQAVLDLIQDANYDERKRRQALGLRGGPPEAASSAGARPPARGPAGQPSAGDSHARAPQRPHHGRPHHRPPPPQGHAVPRQGPPPSGAPDAQARSDRGRHEPPRQNPPRHQPPRNGPPRHGPSQGNPQHGPPRPSAQQGGAPRPAPARPEGREDGRRIEVIVARRPPR